MFLLDVSLSLSVALLVLSFVLAPGTRPADHLEALAAGGQNV